MFFRKVLGSLAALGIALAGTAVSGCGDRFLNEEMHLGDEGKLRPIALLLDPPDAAPGELVTATLLTWEPDPAGTGVSWRLALDFDSGFYGSEPKEDHVIDLETIGTIGPAVDEGNGFITRVATFTVPANTLVGATSLDPLLDDNVLGEVAEELFPGAPPEEVGKDDIDALLANVTAADLTMLDEESRRGIWAVADLFACAVRLRVTLENGIVLDVTRNLTVRHSGRLGSPNVNGNPVLATWEVVGVSRDDFDLDDLDTFDGEVQRWSFLGAPGSPPEVRVPRREGWTYYLVVDPERETYGSPFSLEGVFEENARYRWYWFQNTNPGDGHPFFRDDQGDETEMSSLDDSVRFEPPVGAGESRFRVFAVVRDERIEWGRYAGPPA